MTTDDHKLIDALLDVVPTEATPGNRLLRLDAKYRAPEKLSKLQPRHQLLIKYMIHGISSPVRCRQLRIGEDQPLSLIEAADAARVRRREARRIAFDPLFRQALARELKPELNSKRRNGACNTLISLFWNLDFSKTWCHVCPFIRLECCL